MGHPERIALFVGDFLDRGPENLRACRIVMDMTAAGAARAVLGNHDFNHLCLATPDADQPGTFLRPHTAKNLHQAATTLAEFARDPDGARAALAWLGRLPLWLDLKQIRAVHAAWSGAAQAVLAPFLDPTGALDAEGLRRANRPGDPVRRARQVLLTGPEADLPPGQGFTDADGHARSSGRVRWWLAGSDTTTWRDAILAPGDAAPLPASPLPQGVLGAPDPDQRPVVFGHYCMRWPLVPLTPRHACVDASVAAGGRLAAYRFSGERRIEPTHFVAI